MIRCFPINLFLLLAVWSVYPLAARASNEVALTFLSGQRGEASLIELTAETAMISRAGAVESVPLSELLRIDVSRTKAARATVRHLQFVDGSLLPIEKCIIENRQATVSSPLSDQEIQLDADEIALLYLRQPSSKSLAYVEGVLRQSLPGDAIIVQKGDPPQFDHLTGILGDVDSESVKFNWENEDIVVKRKKLAAVLFYHADKELETEVNCWVTTVNGARLNAKSVLMAQDSPILKVSLHSGIELSVPLEDIASLDLSAGKLVYLSDLQPIRQKWSPLVGLPEIGSLRQNGLARNDVSYAGTPLSLRWPEESDASAGLIRHYAKGIAVRSGTEIEFRISPGAKEFRALAGIDPRTADTGHVRLEIAADKTVLWEGEISGKKPPVDIELELPIARRLRFIVDYGENLDYGDRLHLVEARMTK